MKLLLDACVLYPTVMREMLIGAARKGLFVPFWSARILEEWARAAARHGNGQEAQARGEIALLRAEFPQSELTYSDSLEARLWLPDDNDIHVLAAAVSGSTDQIITLNAKDFPRGILAEEGLERRDPDAVLYDFWLHNSDMMEQVGKNVLAEARRLSDKEWTTRALFKKARLPRLAKALSHAE